VRYSSLEKAFPEESLKLRAAIEEEYRARYQSLKRLAEVEPPQTAEGGPGVCTSAPGAEHARPGSKDDACDDGRAGK